MQSHSYNFSKQDLMRLVVYPLLPLVLFAIAMHLGVLAKVFPAPLAILDTDRTIIFHQAAAANRTQSAQTVLIGDSSCLMDAAAVQLSACATDHSPVLNLATLSYLDLRSDALLLQHYLLHNNGTIHTVVLLMHPEALRQADPGNYYSEMLRQFYLEQDFCDTGAPNAACWLGVETFQGRFLARILPVPLGGVYGKKYGFTKDLWNYLSEDRGSANDPGHFDATKAQGNSEYRLASSLEAASRDFARVLPKQVKLYVGITPIPESQALRNYRQTYDKMLEQFGHWLDADKTLTELPPTLPDRLFATKTHLNEAGQRQYTQLLCSSVRNAPTR